MIYLSLLHSHVNMSSKASKYLLYLFKMITYAKVDHHPLKITKSSESKHLPIKAHDGGIQKVHAIFKHKCDNQDMM